MELQNRVTHYDVTNDVTNSKILKFVLKFFELVTRCERNLTVGLEVTGDFQTKSELLTQKIKKN